MSSSEEDEELGESPNKSIHGEHEEPHKLSYQKLIQEEVIVPKSLTFGEASECLHMLAKDESGLRYAYVMITALDKKLTDVSVLCSFTHVLFVELGGNKLTLDDLRCLSNMPFLVLLAADRNRIETCNLDSMFYLQVLNFSKNKIVQTTGLKQLALECLDLSYNFIEKLNLIDPEDEGVPLPKLKQLELRGNLLQSIAGFYPTSLVKLYLAENQIVTIDGLTMSQLVNLEILHLRDNMLKKLNGFSNEMRKLRYINVRKNNITMIKQIGKLSDLPSLNTLVIIENPICPAEKMKGEEEEEEEEEEYGEDEAMRLDKFRLSVLVLLPKLKRINKAFVRVEERIASDSIRQERMWQILAEESEDEDFPLSDKTDSVRPFSP